MKVILPSLNAFPIKSVELSVPTFGAFRAVQMYNVEPLLRKVKLVTLCSSVNLSKISWDDLEYLYDLLAFTVLNNNASFKVTCPQGHTFNHKVQLSSCDIVQLSNQGKKPKAIFFVGLRPYKFRLLSAQDVLDSFEFAQSQEDEEFAFLCAKRNLALGKSLDSEFSQSLPMSLGLSVDLYQKLNYHGIKKQCQVTCPECGEVFNLKWDLGVTPFDISLEKLMDYYASVSDRITFSDFMSMSIREFNAMVNTINKMMR
jgi:hypothetical protein